MRRALLLALLLACEPLPLPTTFRGVSLLGLWRESVSGDLWAFDRPRGGDPRGVVEVTGTVLYWGRWDIRRHVGDDEIRFGGWYVKTASGWLAVRSVAFREEWVPFLLSPDSLNIGGARFVRAP